MGSPLDTTNYISRLWGAASLKSLGTIGIRYTVYFHIHMGWI